jgi:predicted DNA-binding transcriptional regulator AlpA
VSELLTAHEAALLLGISYDAFHKRTQRDKRAPKPVRIVGRTFLWDADDIKHWNEEQ